MGKINWSRVFAGGIVAGVVLNIIDFLINNYLVADRMRMESDRFHPGLADQMMAGNAVYGYVAIDLLMGIALIWTYAAIRPRFGPGMKTATFAAILFWVVLSIAYWGYMQMGMMSSGLWWTVAALGLANLLIASWAGGAIYKEDSVVTV